MLLFREGSDARRKGMLNEGTLLFVVLGQIAHGRRCRWCPTSVTQLLSDGHVFKQMMLDVEPGPLVFRLVLNPDHFCGVFVLAQLCLESLVGEWVELLNADDGNISTLGLVSRMDQIVVDPT